MNKFFFLFAFCACLVGCGNKCAYTVNGTVEQGINIGDSIYLQYIDQGAIYTIGYSALRDGQFSFKGESCEPLLCYLVSVRNGKVRSNAEFFVEPGNINIKIGPKRSTLSGTFLNTRLQEYNDSIDIINAMFMNFYNKSKVKTLSQKGAEEADKGMKVVGTVRSEYVARFIEKNIDNPVAKYILTKNYDNIAPEKGLELISAMPLENKSDTTIRHIENTFSNKILTAEGKRFVDFAAYTNEGKRVKLSDYVGKGKIAVLNVMCTTGRSVEKNATEFKALADTYKERVEFVSFAIENNVATWNETIKKYDFWWNNISDMQGWGSKAVFSYGINSSPYNIIFDRDGTILIKGIKTEDLYSIIDGYIKK